MRGTQAWNGTGSAAAPAPGNVDERLLQIVLTPHGFLKAARRYGATPGVRTEGGRDVTTLTVTPDGKPAITASLDERYLIVRVESLLDNTVLGDMAVEAIYSDYADFAGTKFPRHVVQRQGGHPTLDITVTEVIVNPVVAVDAPGGVSPAVPPHVLAQSMADGVWYLTGGTHHSVAVAFSDHVVVVEAPQNEARSMAVIAKVKELAPGKPIRYLVNTHQHFDHSGGVRAFAAEGVTIVTHALYKPYYETIFANPHTIAPDRLARSGRRAVLEAVTDKKVLTDGSRTMELHHTQGNLHNDGLLMAYLPQERFLIQADGFSPGPPGSPPPRTPNPFTVNLYENIERLRLDVARILPLHGGVATMDDLRTAIGKGRRGPAPAQATIPGSRPRSSRSLGSPPRARNTYLRAQFFASRSRRGPKKAIPAVAASILTAAYYILKNGSRTKDLGADHFERRDRAQIAKRLVQLLENLGLVVEIRPTA